MSRRLHALVFVTSLMLSACDTDNVNSVKTPDWSVDPSLGVSPTGPVFEHDDFKLIVRALRLCPTDSPMAPAAGLTRISIPVELEARSARDVTLTPMDFTLSDRDGVEYRPTLAGCAPVLPRKELTKPMRLRGEVAFDVPDSKTQWTLDFHPFLVGRREIHARVLVPLGSR